MKSILKIILFIALIALIWFFVVPKFMGGGDKEAISAGSGGTPQAIPVSTVTIAKEPIKIWKDFSARLEATQLAQIRPRVSGTITDIRFQDGQNVKKGQILFVIDPRPFEASLAEAKASLSSAQNDAELARTELDRAERLIDSNAISQRIFTERQNTLKVAQARIDAAQAFVKQASLNIDYAYIKAPFSGQIGRAEIKEGNLVGAGEPILTTLVANDKIYADFEVDDQTYLSFIRTQNNKKDIEVRLKIEGKEGSYDGVIDSFDNQIDTNSGTIRGRALFSNDDGALLPGMFATVEIGGASSQERIVVSERAIATNQNQKIVFVIGEDKTAQPRFVELGDSIEGKRIILSGLNEGDVIISEGLIKIRPGAPVIPKSELPPPPPQADGSAPAMEP